MSSMVFPVSFVVHIGVLLQVFLRALSFRLSVISSPLFTLFHLPYVGSTVGPLDSSLHRDTVTVGPLDSSLHRDTVTLDRLYVQPIILGTSSFLRTVEPRLSELRLTETSVRRCDSQNCLPRDTSEPLAVSLLSKVDMCASCSAVVTFV